MKSNPGHEQKWRQIIKEYQTSGMSVTDFSKQRGFSDVTFYSWRKKLTPPAPKKLNKKFVPVVIEPKEATTTIHHGQDVSPEWLARYTLEILKVIRR